MSTRIPIDRPVIVEGRYDKATLQSVIDATIITTDGFGIFRQHEKAALLRRLGTERGVIVLTDSDGGGTQIRSYLARLMPPSCITHLYIPRIPGKERRKKTPSRSGVLGVEGMDADLLRGLFAPLAADRTTPLPAPLTKLDLYLCGLSGGEGSAERRDALAARLQLPPGMPANALLAALNLLLGREGFLALPEAAPLREGADSAT